MGNHDEDAFSFFKAEDAISAWNTRAIPEIKSFPHVVVPYEPEGDDAPIAIPNTPPLYIQQHGRIYRDRSFIPVTIVQGEVLDLAHLLKAIDCVIAVKSKEISYTEKKIKLQECNGHLDEIDYIRGKSAGFVINNYYELEAFYQLAPYLPQIREALQPKDSTDE